MRRVVCGSCKTFPIHLILLRDRRRLYSLEAGRIPAGLIGVNARLSRLTGALPVECRRDVFPDPRHASETSFGIHVRYPS